MTIKVVTDSAGRLTKEQLDDLDIAEVSIHINTSDGSYLDSELDLDSFYAQYLENPDEAVPTSSQPSVAEMQEAFLAAAREGRDLLGIFLSEKLSGTIQSARIAAKMVAEEFSDWRYEMLDSRSVCFQEAFTVMAAATQAKMGKTLQECRDAALRMIDRTRFLFVPESLESLRRGGRIGRVSALLGSTLQIRPVLGVLDGEAHVFKKVRTSKKAIEAMVQMFTDDIERCGLVDVVVHYIGDRSQGIKFSKEYVEPIVGHPVPVYPVSPVIGLHVGAAVGVIYQTEEPI